MLHVACVKWGKAYGPEYVNTLFDMVRRNLPAGFPGDFVCLTDDPTGLEEGIKTLPLPGGLTGWWNKLCLFAPGVFPDEERVLYFDLDTVITGPLDSIATYRGGFTTLRDAYRPNGLQSAVMMWEVGCEQIWEVWHHKGCPMDERGDQGFIEDYFGEKLPPRLQDLFPEKFRSYKVECRNHIPKGTSVVFFHGHPRPHEVTTGWVPEVWKVGGGSGIEWVVTSNTDDKVLRAQVSHALTLNCAWLKPGNDTTTAIIVGGGPSLTENLFYIRGMQAAGGKVFATGNTYKYLQQQGIQPDAHVLLDAREDNYAFVPVETCPKYYASQCHPRVLAAAGPDLICWHAAMTSYESLVQDHEGAKVGGGTTVGLKAIALAFALGHRHLRLFGFDSSYGPSHHAYEQTLNDGEKTVDVTVAGRHFKCAPWMVSQYEDFKELVPILLQQGCVLRIFGDGLIPHVAALLESPQGEIKIDGLWWPSDDVHTRQAVLGTLDDLSQYIGQCAERRVAVQAGGNVGVWPKRLAEHFQHVITFEPDPRNWACLVRNVREPNVLGFNVALGERAGEVSIHHDDQNCGASYVEPGDTVKVKTLDEFELDWCDLLQLDVEGFEFKALRGARQTIERCSPVIVVELKGLGDRYGDPDERVVEWLSELGYTRVGDAHRDVIFKRISA
jgi:FkbM family methyltransferase